MKNFDYVDLGLTRLAAELYFLLPHEEVEKLVSVCAKKDWGDHTQCLFFDDKIEVENFDGRKEIICGVENENDQKT